MDHQTFDRLTRLVGTAASRRTAWRALLGAALLGATTRSAAAEPCRNDKPACGSGCCPGRCFTFVSDAGGSSRPSAACAVCCTEENKLVICGGTCCQYRERGDPCDPCDLPPPPTPDCPSASGLAGSYRRR
jgi:hypothetical protein